MRLSGLGSTIRELSSTGERREVPTEEPPKGNCPLIALLNQAPDAAPASEIKLQVIGNETLNVKTNSQSSNGGIKIPPNSTIKIGIQAGACDVVIWGDKRISKSHCTIQNIDGHFYITNNDPKNRTYVRGYTVTEPTEINSGDRIKLGDTVLEFNIV